MPRSFCLLVLLPSIFAAATLAPAADQPNVLLVITDDQGYGDVRSHGNDGIRTPIQDKIAASGARFDRFFVSPVCAPTRASLLSGRWHLRTGVHGVTRAYETMRADEVTIAEHLHAAGYATAAFGKWHNGAHYPQHPNGQGFDEFYGFCAGHWNNYFDGHLEHNGTPVRFEGYIIDTLTDKAIDWIKANRERPFFCYVPYNTPHSPWQVPEKYWQRYKDRKFLTDAGKPTDLKANCAYAMVENIDDNLGRLLETIDEIGKTEETIVIFLTDNGANSDRYNAGMKGRKGSLHEGGTRVPLFIRWPGKIKPGTKIPQIASHVDLLPTILELTGTKPLPSKPIDGKSLVPLLTGKGSDWPERTLFTHWGGTSANRGAVRTQRWRAVKYGTWELYDMQADPAQKLNLARQKPEVLSDLRRQFDGWFADVTKDGFDPIPTSVGYAESPVVRLSGHEAILNPGPDKKAPGISYHGRQGWANDYVTNWTSTDCYPRWDLDVVQGGTYEFALHYICSKKNVGTRFRVEVGEASMAGRITEPHDPRHVPSPDRIARNEVYEYEWKRLPVGSIVLTPGKTSLTVRALSKPGDEVMNLKMVEIRRLR